MLSWIAIELRCTRLVSLGHELEKYAAVEQATQVIHPVALLEERRDAFEPRRYVTQGRGSVIYDDQDVVEQTYTTTASTIPRPWNQLPIVTCRTTEIVSNCRAVAQS